MVTLEKPSFPEPVTVADPALDMSVEAMEGRPGLTAGNLRHLLVVLPSWADVQIVLPGGGTAGVVGYTVDAAGRLRLHAG